MPKPIPFVVGVGRSGTTLLRFMLDSHPDMAVLPELNWLEVVIDDLDAPSPDIETIKRKILKTQSWPDLDMDADALDKILLSPSRPLGGHLLRELHGGYMQRFEKTRSGSKTPKDVLRMPWLQRQLPEARFVHLIRDGRDVVLSRMSVWMSERSNIRKMTQYWKTHLEQGRKDAKELNHYMEIRYEDLVSDPESVLAQVCDFCELSLHPDQLKFYERSTERLDELKDIKHHRLISAQERRDMFALTRHPPTKARIGKWRSEMSKDDLEDFMSVAGDLLIELGYGD